MIYKSLLDLIGNTPVLEFDGLYIKLEQYNITGSVKDRPLLNMINGLEKDGILKKGDVLIEPTSGNTGISLALVGKVKGYKVILVMPESMSVERRKILKAYGAELILTEASKGMGGAIEEAYRLAKENNYIVPQQFENFYNVKAHEETTAKEIINDFEDLDYVVAGVGTGGTITGLGKTLKSKFKNIKIVAVEPEESPVLSKNTKGPHGIQGIGAGFKPTILDLNVVDEIRTVSTTEAKETQKNLALNGLFLGISSGAAIKIGYDLKKENPGKKILIISPDNGYKYLSLIND